jgi:hypothetical protein
MTRRRLWRAAAAALIPVAMLVALLAWGVSSPPGSGPDDDYHMASIWCATGEVAGQCEATDSDRYRMLPSDVMDAALCFKHEPTQAATCPLDPDTMVKTDRGNWYGGAYPPLYYFAMSAFAGEDLSTSIVIMRSTAAVLYVGLLTALFFLLPRPQRVPLVWGAAISIVPLGMFLIPSVNPSGWALLSASGLWVATWGWFDQTGWRKWALGAMAAVFLVVGAGARSDAAVYGGLALVAATVLGFRRDRRFAAETILPAVLLAVAVAFFFSGTQSGIVSSETAQESTLSMSTLAFVDAKLLPELWVGALGYWGLGWLDTKMPGIVWVTTTALFGAMMFWGLSRGYARKWIALSGVFAALVIVPIYILLHDGVIIGSYVQPRYIYPIIVILGGVALAGFARANLGMRRVHLIVAGGALSLANAVALHVNMRRYITGIDNPNFNLDAPIEWWWGGPISPMTVWSVGSIAFAMALFALVATVWNVAGAGDEAISGPTSPGSVPERAALS